MQFKNAKAEIFIPDGEPLPGALQRTTHLAVAAHQDDIEIMATEGILQCFRQQDRWFTGVTVTNGCGSPRTNVYGQKSDEEMQRIRQEEQKTAASIGRYGSVVLLNYPSSAVKGDGHLEVVEDLARLLHVTRPQVVYAHNPADRHETHVAVALRTIEALRSLPAGLRPQKVHGCEVWRDLDWLVDEDKVVMDVSAQESLQMALLGVYDSQITGGKRYDLAAMGRRRMHATFLQSHVLDHNTAFCLAMDLTPLITDPRRDVKEYVLAYIDRFRQQVETVLSNLWK